jgi:indolepyruvate ferredoxin oxidoreductase alpha subunit
MGGSDSMRQGFVLSRPEMAHLTISVIGDSCECHSGLDATRNAVFRNTPGVKVILDNSITAMTGGQPAPSSKANLEGIPNKFVLKEAVAAEKGRTIAVDSYNLEEVERVLTEALELAEKGEYTTLILEGPCIRETEGEKKVRRVRINTDKCKQCGLCGICPGIELDENKNPHFTSFCTNCGSNSQVCMQRCAFGAIESIEEEEKVRGPVPELPEIEEVEEVTIDKSLLPESLRVAIRGIGGQGNLFFGKVLSEVALRTPYSDAHIVKGDTHGMAQLGGPVISTFSCGNVYSPILAPNSVDILVVMEISEAMRPGFLNLLKPEGKILLNVFKALPANIRIENYPSLEQVEKVLADHASDVINIDAAKIARDLGDKTGKTANVVLLGKLSTIAPFDIFPRETWLSALMSVSPNDFIKFSNQRAFNAGRNY